MNNALFRAFCLKVADEGDPKKLELLKQRLRLLLSDEDSEPPAIEKPKRHRHS
jgi:hypothetical protein